jgi:uncharacterized protein (TIGR02145 family)
MAGKSDHMFRRTSALLAWGFLLGLSVHTCQRFEPESELVFTTDQIDALADRNFRLNGTIINLGIDGIDDYGFCWSENRNPTTQEEVSSLGQRSSTGSFSTTIGGLRANRTYYVRAYIMTGSNTRYGDEESFTTPAAVVPVLTTDPVTSVTENSAVSGGNITDTGGEPVTERGVCWSISTLPTLSDAHTNDGDGGGSFTSSIGGLECETTYYIRAYATNSAGTAYGNQLEFTTENCPAGLPVVTTNPIGSITENAAQGGGNVVDNGESPVQARGVCWSASHGPTINGKHTMDGTGTGTFTSDLTSLDCETTYYVRAYATNSTGTSYGSEVEFTTAQCPENLPTVTTAGISGITEISAMSGGTITDNGGLAITARGVCWSTIPNPTIEDSYTTDGSGDGSYTSAITGLICGTTYYVRAYATNDAGTAYGSEQNFTTSSCPVSLPEVTTAAITNVTENSAQGGGEVTGDGGAAVTARGICWNTSPNPTTANAHSTDGTGTGTFTSSMTGLSCETTYYVRAYATNAAGTAYGSEKNFTTSSCPAGLPEVTTAAITNVTENSALGGGEVTGDGGKAVTARGICWSTSPNPTTANDHSTDGTGTGTFTSSMTGLTCETIYYVRAYATNSEGTAYGTQRSFTTGTCPAVKPTVTTAEVTNVQTTSATCGGEVTDDGGATVTARGVCWSTSSNPSLADNYSTDGNGTGSFTSILSSLAPNTPYYVRAYATNSAGTSYGSEKAFQTLSDQVTDYDGNVYHTTVIGDQVWLTEDIRATHYTDGSPISLVEGGSAWAALGDAAKAYCWFNNSTANRDTYGALYTWAAVMNGAAGSTAVPSGVQGVCPDGWHVPSDAEWQELEKYLGMNPTDAGAINWRGDVGGALREAGTAHWTSPNTGATNSSGFTALPGGYRSGNDGDFLDLNTNLGYWTATEDVSQKCWDRGLMYDRTSIFRGSNIKNTGFSVRCLKD